MYLEAKQALIMSPYLTCIGGGKTHGTGVAGSKLPRPLINTEKVCTEQIAWT